MYWEEDKDEQAGYQVPDDVVDLIYNISCKMIPLDHAFAFSEALKAALPWLADEEKAGVHLIHGAESGNGWFRPEHAEGEVLHLSRRARMSLRVPKERIADAEKLIGQVLDIEGYSLEIGKVRTKELSALPTLFARYIVSEADQTEEAFLEYVVQEMRKLGVPVRKMMAGRTTSHATPDGKLHTRSVMVADLEPDSAVMLQQVGIGPHRKMGCGLFIPHKGIKAVHEVKRSED